VSSENAAAMVAGVPVALWTALLGAVAGAIVALSAAHRRIRLESVTTERQKWRDKVRGLATRVFERHSNPDFESLSADLALNLNPFDPEDIAIVNAVRALGGGRTTQADRRELADRFALLLKHDWERSKRETAVWPMRLIRPTRVTYRRFQELTNGG